MHPRRRVGVRGRFLGSRGRTGRHDLLRRRLLTALETLHENVSLIDSYDGFVGNDEEDIAEIATEEAESLVASWPDYDLDFTLASIERLDALVVAELADTFADAGEDEIWRSALTHVDSGKLLR